MRTAFLTTMFAMTFAAALCAADAPGPAPASRPATRAATPQDPAALLPADGADVDVMRLTASPREQELAAKLQRAVAQDPVWWKGHVAKAKIGEPLAYDARLGLTREEYAEYQTLTMGLARQKVIKATVTRTGGRVTLRFGDQLPDMPELVLDAAAGSVATPMGVAAERSTIVATEDQKVTGPWSGVQWRAQEIDDKRGTKLFLKVAIGKRTRDGRGLLYYDARRVTPAGREQVTQILLYDLAAPRP
jgi:hypothetical protein